MSNVQPSDFTSKFDFESQADEPMKSTLEEKHDGSGWTEFWPALGSIFFCPSLTHPLLNHSKNVSFEYLLGINS